MKDPEIYLFHTQPLFLPNFLFISQLDANNNYIISDLSRLYILIRRLNQGCKKMADIFHDHIFEKGIPFFIPKQIETIGPKKLPY